MYFLLYSNVFIQFSNLMTFMRCRCLQHQLTVLIQSVSPFVFKESNLKLLIDAAAKNPTYGPAHLLVFLGINSYLKADWIKELLAVPDENGVYPIHVACKVPLFHELISHKSHTYFDEVSIVPNCIRFSVSWD